MSPLTGLLNFATIFYKYAAPTVLQDAIAQFVSYQQTLAS
jgi:hypothetical protein